MDKSSLLVVEWDKWEVAVTIVDRDTRNFSRVVEYNIVVVHPMATKCLKDKMRTFGTHLE